MIARRVPLVCPFMLATVLVCAGAVVAFAQALPLKPVLEGDVSVAAPREYIVTAKAGDVVSGTFELLRGDPIGVQFFDPAGLQLNEFIRYETGTSGVGFAAPVNGSYRIRIYLWRARATSISASIETPDDRARGSFRLSMQTRDPAARMAGVHVEPVVRYVSPRMTALTKDVEAGQAGAVARFWEDVAGKGHIVEPIDNDAGNVLVTFLWKETYETHNVLLLWPPDYQTTRSERDYYMTRIAGTNIWYKTLRIARGSRFNYQLAPNHRPEEGPLTAQWEILELAGAPDESWAMRIPAVRGELVARKFESELLKGSRPVSIYTPPGYNASAGPYPLLLVFDAPEYLSFFKAPTTLDNLIADHRIRPPVVCFLTFSSDPKLPTTRPQDMGASWRTFADAMATELVPWLRSSYSISANPKDVTVGGYSGGGRGAALVALRHSEVFGNVLSQSGSFGGPLVTSSGKAEVNGISRLYIEAARLPLRFYLDVGLYEPNTGNLPIDEAALTEGLTTGNRHFRDVLEAKGYEVIYRETGGQHVDLHFRATFAEGLMALLSPATRR